MNKPSGPTVLDADGGQDVVSDGHRACAFTPLTRTQEPAVENRHLPLLVVLTLKYTGPRPEHNKNKMFHVNTCLLSHYLSPNEVAQQWRVSLWPAICSVMNVTNWGCGWRHTCNYSLIAIGVPKENEAEIFDIATLTTVKAAISKISASMIG